MSAPWLLAMEWRDICTAHWRVDPVALAALLPPGLTLDRYDGDAWLTVVPFRMSGIHVRFAPVLPGFADVAEINLRTYVRVGALRGVYFFSLDAASPLLVRAARLTTGLPYSSARIAQYGDGPNIRFSSERLGSDASAGRFAASYEPFGEARVATPHSLEAFLHERYRYFLRRAGGLWSGEVRHEPWPLQGARIEIATNTLGALANEMLSASPERCWFVRRLEVRAAAVMPLRSFHEASQTAHHERDRR